MGIGSCIACLTGMTFRGVRRMVATIGERQMTGSHGSRGLMGVLERPSLCLLSCFLLLVFLFVLFLHCHFYLAGYTRRGLQLVPIQQEAIRQLLGNGTDCPIGYHALPCPCAAQPSYTIERGVPMHATPKLLSVRHHTASVQCCRLGSAEAASTRKTRLQLQGNPRM